MSHAEFVRPEAEQLQVFGAERRRQRQQEKCAGFAHPNFIGGTIWVIASRPDWSEDCPEKMRRTGSGSMGKGGSVASGNISEGSAWGNNARPSQQRVGTVGQHATETIIVVVLNRTVKLDPQIPVAQRGL